MSDIVKVQGLDYHIPKPPPRHKIRGNDLPKIRQVWHRREEYLQWDWNTDPNDGDVWFKNPAEGQLEWYEEEIGRLNYGDWIIIEGKPVYFNNYCYFFHQWHTLQEGIYADYRDTSLEFFRFFEIIDKDPFTLGICGIKGRRLGMSSMASSIQLLICMLESNTLNGIVSKTNTDAKELYYMIKFSLENLPSFLMPDMRNIGEKELFFDKPVQRVSKNNKATNSKKSKGLNNRAGYLATAENSYDGRRLRSLILDEAGKYEEANITTLFSKISETLATGASVVGKVLMFSTVNAMDKGGANFKAIWDDSDHEGKLDLMNQTPSRLKRFFIAGYKGVMGYIDRYGNSVVDKPTPEQTEYLRTVVDPTTGNLACPLPEMGAKEYRQMRRDMKRTKPEEYAEEVRKFPFTWQEVFKSATNQCNFDITNLQNRIEKLEGDLQDLGLDTTKGELGRRGMWYKDSEGLVQWKDDTDKGLWYVHKFLPRSEANKFEIVYGKKTPMNTAFGAGGMDAFANANKTAEKGSDACIIIRERYSSVNPDTSGIPVAMFLGRTSTKREFHNQMAWGLQYYGVMLLGERAPTDWVDYMIEEKLESYLIETSRKSDGTKVYGLAPQDKQAREEHLTEQIDSSNNDHHKIPYIRLCRDRLLFDIDNRTDFDTCMADGMALMALKKPYEQKKPETKTRRVVQKGKITTY